MKTLIQTKLYFLITTLMVCLFSMNANGQCHAGYTYSIDATNKKLVHFTNTSTNDSGCSYYWFYSGGNSSLKNPDVTFANYGTFNVCLIISRAGCFDSICNSVVLTGPPACHADYTYAADSVTPGLIHFTNTSTNDSGCTYSWRSVGNRIALSSLKNPDFTYVSPGTYTVNLTIYKADCFDSLSKPVVVTVGSGQCLAAFNYTTDSFNYKKKYFTSACLNDSGCSYFWKFDSTFTSTSKNPDHIFGTKTSYTVCLFISKAGCSDSFCVNISNFPGTCKSNFTSSTDTSNTLKKNFTSTSTNDAGSSYKWYFGDNTTFTSTTKTTNHTYASNGSYLVCLRIAKPGCSDSLCKTVTVGSSGACVAGFTHGRDTVHSPWTVSFYNSGPSTGQKYLWKYGDGSTSTSYSAGHTYYYAGMHIVTLLAYTNDSSCAAVKIDTVYTSFPCSVKINNLPSTGNGFGTFMIADPVDSAKTYRWDLGDGATKMGWKGQHVYPHNGYYTVYLYANTADSSCVTSDSRVIHLMESKCRARFFYNLDSIDRLKIHCINNSDSTLTYLWTFGDGNSSTQRNADHIYSKGGTYTICLQTTNTTDTSCYDKACGTISGVGYCAADFSHSSPDTSNLNKVYFQNKSFASSTTPLYLWVFGDGGTSTQQQPTHTYASSGHYQVCLYVMKPDSSCSDSKCDSIVVNGGSAPCKADFTFPPTIQQFDSVHFVNTSLNDSGATFTWSFGDNTPVSHLKDPWHFYGVQGARMVCLIMSKPGCADSVCKVLFVNEQSSCNADFEFHMEADSGSNDSIVVFTNTSSGSGLSYYWDFGDSATSETASPSHHYATGGQYMVCLVIYNFADSCVDSTCKLINYYTGIEQLAGFNRLHVYPVPFSSEINIDFNSPQPGNCSIMIYDVLGSLHHSETRAIQGGDNHLRVEPGELSKGFYFLRLGSGDKTTSVRVIK